MSRACRSLKRAPARASDWLASATRLSRPRPGATPVSDARVRTTTSADRPSAPRRTAACVQQSAPGCCSVHSSSSFVADMLRKRSSAVRSLPASTGSPRSAVRAASAYAAA